MWLISLVPRTQTSPTERGVRHLTLRVLIVELHALSSFISPWYYVESILSFFGDEKLVVTS